MASTRHDGRNYQEDADSAAAIAAVAAANDANAEADTFSPPGPLADPTRPSPELFLWLPSKPFQNTILYSILVASP